MFLALALLLIPNQQLYAQKERGMTIIQKDSSDLVIKGNYWAFIIGINEYLYLPPEKQLEAARPDAQALARLLKEKYGFRVVELYDRGATRKNIHSNLRTFSKQLSENDNLLIYYAGHGEYEKETHLGGWLPSDAKSDEVDTYFSNEEIRAYLKSIKAKHIYTITDSCFSQALMGTKTRSLRESSVNELYNDKSRWVLTSGGYYPVPDKGKGDHSVFAYYLIRILEKNEEKYLPVDKLYGSLRDAVSNETTQQTPRSAPIVEAGDEGGQFIFVYAYAKKPSIEDMKDNHRNREQQERLREEMAKKIEEEMRKFKEEYLKIEQEKSAVKAREEEQQRLHRDREAQQRKSEEEKLKIEKEKQELRKKKDKGERVFSPPAF